MRYAVICYAIHQREISSVDFFTSEEESFAFVEKDSENVYQEEVNACGVSKENVDYTLDGRTACVSTCDGENTWTWEVITIPEMNS